MRRSSILPLRGLAALLAFAMAAALVAPPASAAEAPRPQSAARASLAAATAAHLAVLHPAPSAFLQEGATAPTESRSFFHTPTGVAAVVLMVVGGGFTVYKVSKDQKPVKSPIR